MRNKLLAGFLAALLLAGIGGNVAQAATNPTSMKIYLSPSTQENNRCEMGDKEEDHCNELANYVEQYLRLAGFEVKRNTPYMNHSSAKYDSNLWEPSLHWALHTNARGESVKVPVRGSHVYINPSPWALRVGQEFVADFKTVYPLPGNVMTKTPTTQYTELFVGDAPAILDEVVFHDNKDDSKWFHNNLRAIARSRVRALCKAYNVPFVEVSDPKSAAPKPTPNPVPVQGIVLNATTITLEPSKTFNFTHEMKPQGANDTRATYLSSNTNVFTVNQAGRVTAKAVGEATLSVISADGGKKATAKVRVIAPTPTPSAGISSTPNPTPTPDYIPIFLD